MPTHPVLSLPSAEARHRRPARIDDERSVAGKDAGAFLATRVFTREHGIARRRAGGGRRVGVGKAQALSREPVHVGRADPGRAIAADVAVAQVVGQDDDNVWPPGRCRSQRAGNERVRARPAEQLEKRPPLDHKCILMQIGSGSLTRSTSVRPGAAPRPNAGQQLPGLRGLRTRSTHSPCNRLWRTCPGGGPSRPSAWNRPHPQCLP